MDATSGLLIRTRLYSVDRQWRDAGARDT